MFTYEEALVASKNYFNGDSLAAEVFLGKYALRNEKGELLELTPTDMHKRLAKEFARIEEKYPNPLSEQEIFDLFDKFKYIIPQGSPMAGIGNPYQVTSLSNCFVIDSPYDSYAGILLADQQQAQLMKRRGGVGMDLSKIRPKGMSTNNSAKTTDGIGIFMERFSNTTREVAQGGRRGALLLSISVHHPEIETFIKIKRDTTKVTGANISVKLTDEFMNAVKNKKQVELRWPVDSTTPTISRMVDANKIWEEINISAHQSAEPGLLFWDTVKRETPADAYESKGFGSISTNPCGEINLSANFDSCRLLLINTNNFISNPFTDKAKFDYEKYSEIVKISQRLMDDIVDLELECVDKIRAKIDSDPEPEHVKLIEKKLWDDVRKAAVEGRRTGTGVTAVGDAVASMNLVYGSEESIVFIENMYRELGLNCYRETVKLAKERGTFPVYEYELEKNHPFINKIMDLDPGLKSDWKKYGRRNIALTTTAPAGSVSILTQTTSGIEPAFLLSYKRRKKINPMDKEARVDFVDQLGDQWQEYIVYHHGFKNWMEVTGKSESKDSPYFGATSNDINWVNKVKAQAAAQKWICHSISNTTNIPENTSVDVVKDIYMTGWASGCKGVTIYRDGCRTGVLVSNDENKASKETASKKLTENHAPKRPKELSCDIHVMTVRGEKWTFFIGKMDDRPYEVIGGQSKYISIPKRVKSGKIIKYNRTDNPVARYDLHYDYDKGPDEEGVVKDLVSIFENATEAAFTRTVSLSLRHGIPIQYVVEQITKGSEKDDDLFSFSKALSRVLKTYIVDGTKTNKVCEKCSSTQVSYQEGCPLCLGCGTSKCG